MVSINFMGDVMFGELPESFRRGLMSTLVKRGVDPFEHVKGLIEGADANVINLECVLSDSSIQAKPFSGFLISPERFITCLAGAHINVASTANNHALDHGKKAFERSLGLLKDHGIHAIGYRRDSYFQEEPVVLELAGRRVGFLGYNISNFPDEDKKKCVERIIGVVTGVRSSLDTLVVSMHWGEEYTNIPPPYVIRFGKELLEAGCDIIHGHHSHRIQGVIRDGGRIFAPSLGNFIFDQKIDQTRITAVLQTKIQDGSISFEYPAFYMNALYQPVRSPAHDAYVAKITEYVAHSYGEGGADAYREAVGEQVHAGHARNRIRLRVNMLSHFWDYLPYTRQMVSFMLKKPRIYSVIKSLNDISKL
jgi:poly-gamma-glutamate synthesis protein (capsule biosynthesis protein)